MGLDKPLMQAGGMEARERSLSFWLRSGGRVSRSGCRARKGRGHGGPAGQDARRARRRLLARVPGLALAGLAIILAPAPRPTAAATGWVQPIPEWAWQVVDLVSGYRASLGLAPLAWDSRLAAAAQWMADDMARTCLARAQHSGCPLGHVDSLGRSPGERATAFGYPWTYVGENMAWGYPSPAAALEAWKSSPGHQANQTRPEWRVAGGGVSCAVFEGPRRYQTCYYFIMFGALGMPPQLVSLWPCGPGRACISFQRPPPSGMQWLDEALVGVRLVSALDPELRAFRMETDVPLDGLLWGNTVVVGMPDRDGLSFYYGLSLCYALPWWDAAGTRGCSDPAPAGGMAARRFPAGTREHWSFVMGASSAMGTVTVWAISDVSQPDKASHLALYDGLQGYGGAKRAVCENQLPGRACSAGWPVGNAFVSASQAFPPYGEVGVAVRLR